MQMSSKHPNADDAVDELEAAADYNPDRFKGTASVDETTDELLDLVDGGDSQ